MTPPRLLPARTLRLRLAVLYGAVFCASGAALLAIPNVFVGSRSSVRAPGPSSSAIAAAASQHGRDLDHFVTGSIAALAVMVLLSVVLGWLLSGRLLRPLRTITATAREISASNLHRRLDVHRSDDELSELAATLNSLFARLEASFASQRRFVANASHELRTPLAAQRTLLQVALADPAMSAETLRAACEEALTLGEQQERLIEALLTLATSERGVEHWQPLDLGEVANDVLARRHDEAQRRGVHMEATLGAAPMLGDPQLVASLVANLVDNAVRHNITAGTVEISTAASSGRARISVRNTGTAILPDQVDRLFEPFQQLGEARTGSAGGHGLGLAIVRAITTAHGASLTASSGPQGGLDVEVSFRGPAATA